nr:unnamed protein product [Callosobruchus chinensis]
MGTTHHPQVPRSERPRLQQIMEGWFGLHVHHPPQQAGPDRLR